MPMTQVPAGNVVALTGIDKCLVKTATITNNADAHNFRMMKFSVSPVVRVAVDVRDPSDHTKLVEGLKKLVQADSIAQVFNENGQHVIAAAGELHLEICLSELEKTHARCPLKVANPIVTYRETITVESRRTAFTKTANKHKQILSCGLYLWKQGLAEAIESGRISSRQDQKERSKILVEEFGWDLATTKKIWAFGPDDCGPNLLVDATKGVEGLGNIQDSVIAAFQWATAEGVLAAENLRGVRFELLDVETHRDSGKNGALIDHRNPSLLRSFDCL